MRRSLGLLLLLAVAALAALAPPAASQPPALLAASARRPTSALSSVLSSSDSAPAACPPDTRPTSDGLACVDCAPECDQCFGPFPDQCEVCSPNHFLDDTNTCQKCDPSCQGCTGPFSDDCLACDQGNILDPVTGRCGGGCSPGYGPDASGPQGTECRPCADSGCSKCDTAQPGAVCIQCQTGRFASRDTARCEPCHSQCLECSGPLLDECTACPGDHVLLGGRCLEACPPGYFPDSEAVPLGGATFCVACDTLCTACTGPQATDCTACLSGAELQPPGPKGRCQAPDLGQDPAPACDVANCAACLPGHADTCATCAEDFRLTPTAAECIPTSDPCPAGSFLHAATDACRPCSGPCATCSPDDPTICLSCPAGRWITADGACASGDLARCPANGYFEPAIGECQPCAPGCLTCTGPDNGQCTTCAKGHFRFEGGFCGPRCPGRHFEMAMDCIPCHEECADCNGPGPDQCKTCDPDNDIFQRLWSHKCLVECPARTYYIRTVGFCSRFICNACPPGCVECTGGSPSECTRCHPTTLLDPAVGCVTACPEGAPLVENGTCVAACSPGRVDLAGQCVFSCEGCLTCDPATGACLTCPEGKILSSASPATCADACAADEYVLQPEAPDAAPRCAACHESCATCSGPAADQCTSCPAGFFVQDSVFCVAVCPVGFFGDADTWQCRACAADCATCTGPTLAECSRCMDDRLLHQDACLPVGVPCPAVGFHTDPAAYRCVPCSADQCADCAADPDVCSRCKLGFIVEVDPLSDATTCIPGCSDGYIEGQAPGEETVVCVPGCREGLVVGPPSPGSGSSSVSGSSGSLSPPPAGDPEPANCLPECPDGWFDQSAICEACHESCLTCDAPGPDGCTALPPTSDSGSGPSSSGSGSSSSGSGGTIIALAVAIPIVVIILVVILVVVFKGNMCAKKQTEGFEFQVIE
ncbi:hypothetical protein H696_03261 [Fonticula alba]|uniref:EGF-like domain-containing protein n=1 Tax=Fonticula alba TaxID=691883 RepID=A0A058Z6A9_FONAL|nr:hypothetical protein H696_03261 [Fonticula alba]KCV69805.1 hypothetical protein H696_03261 [Fonticula alba]|eukprot:XP_009495411.1 hypothetical protein H696_03261 [Fonticula alba]